MVSLYDKLLDEYSTLYQKFYKSVSFKDLPKCEQVLLAVASFLFTKGFICLITSSTNLINVAVDIILAGLLLVYIIKLPKIPKKYTNQQKNNELKDVLSQNGINSTNTSAITVIIEYLSRKISTPNPYSSLKKVLHAIATMLSITIPPVLSVTDVSLNLNDAKVLIASIIILIVDGNLLVYTISTLLETRINNNKIIMQQFLDDLSELQLINNIEQCI